MIADIAGHAIENGVELIGYMNSTTHEHVTFQHVDGESDLHFEFDDQSNGCYNCVSAVAFRGESVIIHAKNAPDGTLTVNVPSDVENRADVARRLAEILVLHNVEVMTQ